MGVVNLYRRIEACSFPYRRMRLLTTLYGMVNSDYDYFAVGRFGGSWELSEVGE